MAGRAGRRGLDKVGTVVIAAWSEIPGRWCRLCGGVEGCRVVGLVCRVVVVIAAIAIMDEVGYMEISQDKAKDPKHQQDYYGACKI